MKRYLGVDFGTQKIGCAIGDDEIRIAFSRPALLSVEDPVAAVVALCEQEAIDELVVGIPQSTDGSASDQTRMVEAFISLLRRGARPVHTIDERFSTQGVQRQQQHRTLERGQEDSLVAQALLQSYLDAV